MSQFSFLSSLKMLPVLMLLPSLVLSGQFVDICRADSGHRCCSPSMAGSEYWVIRSPGSWTQLELECRWASVKLLVFR